MLSHCCRLEWQDVLLLRPVALDLCLTVSDDSLHGLKEHVHLWDDSLQGRKKIIDLLGDSSQG